MVGAQYMLIVPYYLPASFLCAIQLQDITFMIKPINLDRAQQPNRRQNWRRHRMHPDKPQHATDGWW